MVFPLSILIMTFFSPYLFRLDEMKGVPVGETYRNKVEARVFLHYIADMERKKIEDRLGKIGEGQMY